jgi:hypothetical protein
MILVTKVAAFGLITAFTFDAGQLAISQYPEGPATGHLDRFFYVSLGPRANAEMVPRLSGDIIYVIV